MKKRYLSTIRVVIFLIILVGIGVLLDVHLNQRNNGQEMEMDSGWDISINGEARKNCTISDYLFPTMDKGTKVELTYKFPDADERYDQTAIRMLLRYSYIHAYFNDELIYSCNEDYYNKNQLLGNGYVWINLPHEYANGTLRIVLVTGEKNAFASLDEFTLVKSESAYDWLINRHLVTTIISCFMLLLGILGMLYTIVIGKHDVNNKMALWISMFSLSIAMWMLCNSRMIQVVSDDFHVNGYMEYFGMYLACDSLILYISDFIRDNKSKKRFQMIAILFIVLEAILVVLNNTNVLHFPKTSHLFQACAAIAFVLIIIALARENKMNDRPAEKALLYGIILLITAILMELARYQYNKHCAPVYQLNQSFVPIGAVLFVLSMLFSFLILLMERVADNMERKTLYDMAYKDAMTGLKNRAWCEETMETLEKVGQSYTIINMDLNEFKYVNDTYGHMAGDEILKKFAKILTEVFPETSCVGRMGGDEFIVIMDEIQPKIVDACIWQLMSDIERHNQTASKEEHLSASIGYASYTEGDQHSVWKVYEEADRHMYESKQKMKMQ